MKLEPNLKFIVKLFPLKSEFSYSIGCCNYVAQRAYLLVSVSRKELSPISRYNKWFFWWHSTPRLINLSGFSSFLHTVIQDRAEKANLNLEEKCHFLSFFFFFWYITFYVILLRKWLYYSFFSFLKAPSSWHLTKHFKWLIIDGESLLRCGAQEVFSCTCCFLYVRNEDRTLGFSFMKRIWTRLLLNKWVHILQIPNCTAFFPKARRC